MDCWFSQADLRRLRRALRALVFLWNRWERNPNCFPAAAHSLDNPPLGVRVSHYPEVPRTTPPHLRSFVDPGWPPSPSSQDVSPNRALQTPARLLDPFSPAAVYDNHQSPQTPSPSAGRGLRPEIRLHAPLATTRRRHTPGPSSLAPIHDQIPRPFHEHQQRLRQAPISLVLRSRPRTVYMSPPSRSHVRIPWSEPVDKLDRLLRGRGLVPLGPQRCIALPVANRRLGISELADERQCTVTRGQIKPLNKRHKVARLQIGFRSSLRLGPTWRCSFTRRH